MQYIYSISSENASLHLTLCICVCLLIHCTYAHNNFITIMIKFYHHNDHLSFSCALMTATLEPQVWVKPDDHVLKHDLRSSKDNILLK